MSERIHPHSTAQAVPDVLGTLFGCAKPVIAMMHLSPLPSRPLYEQQGGMSAIVDALRRVVNVLPSEQGLPSDVSTCPPM